MYYQVIEIKKLRKVETQVRMYAQFEVLIGYFLDGKQEYCPEH
jgi:hypothetical protein